MEQMQFASAISGNEDPNRAIQEVLEQVSGRLEGKASFAFLFASAIYRTAWEPLLKQVRQRLGGCPLIGCTGGGILGVDQEMELIPAVSLAAARLPRVNLHPFTVSPEELQEERDPGFWIEKIGASPQKSPVGVLLPEPFSCDVMALMEVLNRAYPKMPLTGGLASGADQAGGNALFFNSDVVPEGAVGALFTGDIELETIVSQGCRPVGRPYIITKAQDNVILELAGVKATEALQKLFQSLPAKDQELARLTLFLGLVMNEQQEKFRRGDFLIRNLIGIDPESGALAIGDRVRVGQTVQFQVRDADSSREDLRQLLDDHSKRSKGGSSGALLFNCLGRGQDLYKEPHYDIRTIRASVGGLPIAGFFCNGEIGPVGGKNFVHGFTSSLGLFRPRSSE